MAEPVRKEKVFHGLPISAGKIVSKVCVFSAKRHRVIAGHALSSDEEVALELRRLEEARTACSEELDKVANQVRESVGAAEAEIFITQKHIMNDPEILAEIRDELIKTRISIEAVVAAVFSRYEEKFSTFDNTYLNERTSDIAEIRQRLLDNLMKTSSLGFACEGQAHCSRGTDRVVVAKELSADMIVHMNLKSVRGIVTEHGGVTSHAAIIARSVGIPSVSGIPNIYKEVYCGAPVLVDGDTGVVVVNPAHDTIRQQIPPEPAGSENIRLLSSPEGTEVQANASMIDDVYQAVAVHADGIGLFRTEISFIRVNRLLSEDEQFALYSDALAIMEGRPVTFRLLDVGGDKDLPFLHIKKEENPFLGWRGARFLLQNSEIFGSQVRALVRLSRKRKIRILFPMVIDALQLEKLCSAVREIALTAEALPENILLGAMFEVPSACLQADKIFSQVDFASIGSNDLIQYLFAVDRNNELVSQDYNPEHPVLWDILKQLSEAGRRAGKNLSICGEMAGRNTIPAKLLALGITSFSVSPRLIPRVRNEIYNSLKSN